MDVIANNGSWSVPGYVNDSIWFDESIGKAPIISQQLFLIISLVLSGFILPVIQVFGITTNVINLTIFWSLDVKNVVTCCFFALASADLTYLLIAHVMNLCWLLNRYVKSWIRLDELSFSMLGYVRWSLMISTMFTTYIAVQRSFCVAMPLRFKTFFTPRKNALILLSLFLLAFALNIQTESTRGMRMFFDPLTNSSYLGAWQAPKFEVGRKVADYTVLLTYPIVVQVVTVVCTVVLVRSLRRSSKFRQASSSAGKESDLGNKDKGKGKEIQIVKAVTFVTLMFIISNVPSIGLALGRRLVGPEFRIRGAYGKLLLTINMARNIIQQLNSSINIVIYYKFNTSYREKLKSLSNV